MKPAPAPAVVICEAKATTIYLVLLALAVVAVGIAACTLKRGERGKMGAGSVRGRDMGSGIGEERSARGRIASAAAEHGWTEMFDDVASNARIYERSGRVIVIGYRLVGAVTGATRMYASRSTPPRLDLPKDELTGLDRGKAEQILAWLAEPESPVPPPAADA
ncbi:uncharacterized protein RMCFA_1384 [Mycolicibacterium fortuitum subsp. acetamidolyticum]|nr:hypothetical protein [Mycolicibacterium fortuitum]GAT01270.1 uncharacterized protein RMCFA_1384 [Mycolicibacterium fortuitum subsp. acetamidolyticum]